MDMEDLDKSGSLQLEKFNSSISKTSEKSMMYEQVRGIAKIEDSLNMIEQEQENFLNEIEYKLSNNRSKLCLYSVAIIILVLIQLSFLGWTFYSQKFT
jgi:hypothetical protein